MPRRMRALPFVSSRCVVPEPEEPESEYFTRLRQKLERQYERQQDRWRRHEYDFDEDSDATEDSIEFPEGFYHSLDPPGKETFDLLRIYTAKPFPKHGKTELQSFTPFMRLPIELRQEIWRTFCRHLSVRSRFYCFKLKHVRRGSTQDGRPIAAEIREDRELRDQTEDVRIVLAVHRESRHFALRLLPDTLSFRRGRSSLHFNKERDVIYLGPHNFGWERYATKPLEPIPGFTEHIHHLGLDDLTFSMLRPPLTAFLRPFTSLQHMYVKIDYSWLKMRDAFWCLSDRIHSQQAAVYGVSFRGPEYHPHTWFWPDLMTQGGREYAFNDIPLDTIAARRNTHGDWVEGYADSNFLKVARESGMNIWPLIEFSQEHGRTSFRKLRFVAADAELLAQKLDPQEDDSDASENSWEEEYYSESFEGDSWGEESEDDESNEDDSDGNDHGGDWWDEESEDADDTQQDDSDGDDGQA